jgi:hypothetical protein
MVDLTIANMASMLPLSMWAAMASPRVMVTACEKPR